MASSLQGQEEGESSGASTLMTKEEDTGTGYLSSCEEALGNDLILEKICGFLPLSDLKTCRLVNRQWKGASQISCVQKCRPIQFLKYSPGGVIYVGHVEHSIEKMPQLIQVISTSGDTFPCKSFGVEAGIEETPEQESSVVNLFRAIAPIAETLSLEDISNVKLFKGDSPQNLNFRRLKSLTLSSLSDDEISSSGILASNLNFCRNIIQHSPQLAALGLNFESAETANLSIAMLESVQGQNIRRLYLWGPFNDNHFNRLAATGLKLHCLWLWIDQESILSGLNNFLSSQSSTLEVLHLRSEDSVKEQLQTSFPMMKKLTQLRFQMRLSSGIQLPRISYAEQFPSLQSLSIVEFPETDLDSLFDFRIAPANTVTTLELPDNLDNPVLIWQAARIFPKVKKLVVPSYAVVVMAVYEAWKKVEELKIKMVWDGDSADQVLTTYDRENQDEENFQPVEFLHNLKVLRLKDRDGLYDHRHLGHLISDRTCRLVLLKLRSLRCLDLSESSLERISEEVLEEMREKFIVLR